MAEDDIALKLLFSRLTWASGMVRERACSELVTLLLNERYRDSVQQQLLLWISQQPLESLTALGLLVLCHARDRGGELPTLDRITTAVARPSLLAWLLLRDLSSESIPDPDLFSMHSGAADRSFAPDHFFERYIRTFVPPVYELEARRIDDRHGIAFYRQWAFEWSKLHTRSGRKPRVPDVNFWMRFGPSRLVALDVVESEFYRSAYLRALAWAASRPRLDGFLAMYHSARVCPVNLDLWLVGPAACPTWWPTVPALETPVETTPAEVLRQVERLWDCQNKHEWFIAEASGIVSEGEVTYELDICGVLQACNGPSHPDLGELFEACSNMGVFPYMKVLRIEGPINATETDYEVELGDWLVWPLAVQLLHGTIPRWQWWRGARGVWSPSPRLQPDDFFVKVGKRDLRFEREGDVFARWSDWMRSFRELSPPKVPPATGQMLLIRRDVVDAAAQRLNASVAWLCRWRALHRKSQYSEDVDEASSIVAFGTTVIVR